MKFDSKFGGYTTDSYTDNTIRFESSRTQFNAIGIQNTDGAESLKFKIIAYMNKEEDIEKTLKSETTLGSGDSYRLNLNENYYDHIKVFAKNDSTNTPATYIVIFNKSKAK